MSNEEELNPLDAFLRSFVDHGRRSMLEMARQGQSHMRHMATRRELDDMWLRLGKVAYRLAEAGELSHPAVLKATERIKALESSLHQLEAHEDTVPTPHENPAG